MPVKEVALAMVYLSEIECVKRLLQGDLLCLRHLVPIESAHPHLLRISEVDLPVLGQQLDLIPQGAVELGSILQSQVIICTRCKAA